MNASPQRGSRKPSHDDAAAPDSAPQRPEDAVATDHARNDEQATVDVRAKVERAASSPDTTR